MGAHEDLMKKVKEHFDADEGFYPEDVPKEIIELAKKIGREKAAPVVERFNKLENLTAYLTRVKRALVIREQIKKLAQADPEMGIKEVLDKRRKVKGELKDAGLLESSEVKGRFDIAAGSALSLTMELTNEVMINLGFEGGNQELDKINKQYSLLKGD